MRTRPSKQCEFCNYLLDKSSISQGCESGSTHHSGPGGQGGPDGPGGPGGLGGLGGPAGLGEPGGPCDIGGKICRGE